MSVVAPQEWRAFGRGNGLAKHEKWNVRTRIWGMVYGGISWLLSGFGLLLFGETSENKCVEVCEL